MRLVVVCCVVLVAATARAERLPARVYTTVDGLANDRVDRGTRDARGYLWFATNDGVSRFDGQRFDSFGVADGLPAAETNDIVAARDGVIWVATTAGIACLEVRGGRQGDQERHPALSAAHVHALTERSVNR